MAEVSTNPNEKIDSIVSALNERLGRMPTEDEVYNFIFGTTADRNAVWLMGVEQHE